MTVTAEALGEVARMLAVATDTGREVPVAVIREEVGLGHEDLEAVLEELRQRGEAVEATPGEWRGPYEDELEERAGDRVTGEAPAPAVSVHAGSLAPARAPRSGPAADAGPTVRLTQAVAAALDDQALGALVKAGISEAESEGVPFTLEVV